MYYQNTISTLLEAIEEKYPGLEKRFFSEIDCTRKLPMDYILWMLEEVQKMETASLDGAVKAARWMGWIFREIELDGIWTNTETRNHVRYDHLLGLDKPH